MEHLRVMNRKEVKPIIKELQGNFGMEGHLDYVFFRNAKGRVLVLSRKFAELDERLIRVNNLGMYFGTIEKDGFRLSIEGAQIVGATKNVVQISDAQLAQWMMGEDVGLEHDSGCYVILRHGDDVVGCGKYKDGRVINSVPKERRILRVS